MLANKVPSVFDRHPADTFPRLILNVEGDSRNHQATVPLDYSRFPLVRKPFLIHAEPAGGWPVFPLLRPAARAPCAPRRSYFVLRVPAESPEVVGTNVL